MDLGKDVAGIHQGFWDWLWGAPSSGGGGGGGGGENEGPETPSDQRPEKPSNKPATQQAPPPPMPEPEIDEDDIADAKRQIRKIAKQLTTKMSRKRKHSKKRKEIAFRPTIRQSISTGGVLIDVKWKMKEIKKPRLLVVMDASGSMSYYIKLLILLAQALKLEISDFELFIFSDNLEYVTDDLHRDYKKTMENLEGRRQWGGGTRMDLALERLLADYPKHLTPRTTVLLLSDLGTSGPERAAELIGEIVHKVRKFYVFDSALGADGYLDEDDAGWHAQVLAMFKRSASRVFSASNLQEMAAAVKNTCLK